MSAALTSIQDVQATPDLRRIPINKVGVKGIRHPVVVKDRSGGFQPTVADFNMYVSLPHDFKGTHMSRFVEILRAMSGPSPSSRFAACCSRWPIASAPRPATSR